MKWNTTETSSSITTSRHLSNSNTIAPMGVEWVSFTLQTISRFDRRPLGGKNARPKSNSRNFLRRILIDTAVAKMESGGVRQEKPTRTSSTFIIAFDLPKTSTGYFKEKFSFSKTT